MCSFNSCLAQNIRLGKVYTQDIEIKDGSTWRKVVEDNWDKERQKMLCRHLGFNETDENKISTKTITNGNIATGNLICYNTAASETSCCIHLEPSPVSTIVKIPSVNCEYIVYIDGVHT